MLWLAQKRVFAMVYHRLKSSFEFETVLKFYNLGASTPLVKDNSSSVISGRRRKAVENIARSITTKVWGRVWVITQTHDP